MGRKVAGALFAASMVVVLVTVDVLFLRHQFWQRLAVNVGLVSVSVAFGFRLLRRR